MIIQCSDLNHDDMGVTFDIDYVYNIGNDYGLMADSIGGFYLLNKENIKIGNHDAVYTLQLHKYCNKVFYNQSNIIFTFDNYYKVMWIGSEITPEIENMVSNTPDSNIDYNVFHDTLDGEYRNYKLIKAVEDSTRGLYH